MNRDQFILHSIALTGDGIKAEYSLKIETGVKEKTNQMSITSHVVPHPDLEKIFDEGVRVLYNVLGFDEILSGFGGTNQKAQKLVIDKSEEMEERLSCHKISIQGKDENRTVIVTGKLKTRGTSIAINSPKRGATDAFDVDLNDAINRLENEAYKYIFEDKQAQLGLEGEGA